MIASNVAPQSDLSLYTQGAVWDKSQAKPSHGIRRLRPPVSRETRERAAFRRIALPKHDILVHSNKGMPRPRSTDSNNAQTSVASVSCYRNSAVGTSIVCHASHVKAVDKNFKRRKKDNKKKPSERGQGAGKLNRGVRHHIYVVLSPRRGLSSASRLSLACVLGTFCPQRSHDRSISLQCAPYRIIFSGAP